MKFKTHKSLRVGEFIKNKLPAFDGSIQHYQGRPFWMWVSYLLWVPLRDIPSELGTYWVVVRRKSPVKAVR